MTFRLRDIILRLSPFNNFGLISKTFVIFAFDDSFLAYFQHETVFSKNKIVIRKDCR